MKPTIVYCLVPCNTNTESIFFQNKAKKESQAACLLRKLNIKLLATCTVEA